ncbi:MAG: DMT family transporter [Parachlamydiales bacterium]
MWLVFVLYALFASVFTVSKECLAFTEPLFFVGSRMATAGGLLLLFQLVRGRGVRIDRGSLFLVAQLAFVAIYLTNALEVWGLQYLTSFKTCFIYSLSPFLTALLSYWLLKDRIRGKQWLALVVGFAGCVPVMLDQTLQEGLAGSLLGFSWAELAVLGAAISGVYGWIVLSRLVSQRKLSPLTVNGWAMLIGGGAALLHSAFVENWNPLPTTRPLAFLWHAGIVLVISNLVAYNLYGYLLRRFSTTLMSFAGFSTFFFTALFGWLFLNERVTWPFYLSAAFVFGALTLYHSAEIRQKGWVFAKRETEY